MRFPTTKPQFDATQLVNLKSPYAVTGAIDSILRKRFGTDYGQPLLEQAMLDLVRAYRGDYPGLLRCDTCYHDLRHSFDSGLAMARLIDGHAIVTPREATEHIDAEHALVGVLLALFHDIGLLRRTSEAHLQGAQLTPIHEKRGVEFMHDYLSKTPLAHLAEKSELIMVTRLTWPVPVEMPELDRAVGSLLGTADIMSQLSDRDYLEKCRDFLFAEFSTFGLAGASGSLYPDPRTLLEKTPGFYNGVLRPRMELEYGGAEQLLKRHFGGDCPYQASIKRNFNFLTKALERNDILMLRRVPVRIVDVSE